MAGYATHVSQQRCLTFKSELFNEAINYICYIFGIQSMYEDQEQAIRAFFNGHDIFFTWKGKLFSSSFTLKASLPLLLLSTKFLSLFLSMEVWQTTHNLSAIFFHCFVGSNDQKIKQTKRRSSCMTFDLTTVQIAGRVA